MNGYWKCKVKFELSWFENRLAFQNLKQNMMDNAFSQKEREVLWYPPVQLANTEDNYRLEVDEKATVVTKRRTVAKA